MGGPAVNLKSAARALGVHYQTAYRYVRAGDLVAVRVGNGYEISESAVEMLRSRLDAQGHLVRAVHPRAAPVASLEDELRLVVEATTLSARLQRDWDFVTFRFEVAPELLLIRDRRRHAPR